MSRLTRILRSQPGEITFLDAFQDALEKINKTHGIKIIYSRFEQGNHTLGRHVYLEIHERVVLDLVEDFHAIVRYISIEGETQELVDRIGVWLDSLIPLIPLHELQQEAINQMENNPLAIVHMAIGAGELADAKSLSIIRTGLFHENELVRLSAAEAAGLTQWQDLRADLISLNEKDPSPAVQSLTSRIIDSSQ